MTGTPETIVVAAGIASGFVGYIQSELQLFHLTNGVEKLFADDNLPTQEEILHTRGEYIGKQVDVSLIELTTDLLAGVAIVSSLASQNGEVAGIAGLYLVAKAINFMRNYEYMQAVDAEINNASVCNED